MLGSGSRGDIGSSTRSRAMIYLNPMSDVRLLGFEWRLSRHRPYRANSEDATSNTLTSTASVASSPTGSSSDTSPGLAPGGTGSGSKNVDGPPDAPLPTTTPTTTQSPPAGVGSSPPVPPVASTTNSESGEATWYAAGSPGFCASPTLAFGTVITVTNVATGAATSCTIDDREGDSPGRIVDMSYEGFSQIADPSQGIVAVTVSW